MFDMYIYKYVVCLYIEIPRLCLIFFECQGAMLCCCVFSFECQLMIYFHVYWTCQVHDAWVSYRFANNSRLNSKIVVRPFFDITGWFFRLMAKKTLK